MKFLPYTLLKPRGIGTADSCYSRATEVVEQILALADQHADLCFSVDTAWAVYAVAVRSGGHSELLKRLLEEGRLDVGASWAGCDWLTDPACIIRDLQAGQKALASLGGRASSLAVRESHLDRYRPILAAFGLDRLILAGDGGVSDAACDLAVHGDLGLRFTSSDAVTLRDAEREIKAVEGPIPMGEQLWCPTGRWLSDLRERAEDAGSKVSFGTWRAPKVSTGSGHGRVSHIASMLPDVHEALSHVTGALLRSERILSLDRCLGGSRDDQDTMETLWKQHLEDLAGVYTGSGDRTKKRELPESCDGVSNQLTRLQAEVEKGIAATVDAGKGPEGIVPLVVFNPSTQDQSGVLETDIVYYGENRATDFRRYEFYRLVDEDGAVVASEEVSGKQVETAEIRLRFAAMDVPAMGYKTYYLVPKPQDTAGPQMMPIQAPGAMMPDFPEPSFAVDDVEDRVSEPRRGLRVGRRFTAGGFILDANEVTGETTILDRRSGTSLLERLRIEAREDSLDTAAGDFSPTGRVLPMVLDGVDLAESGEVSALLRVVGHVGRSPVELACRMYADLPFVDITASVSWRDRHPAMVEMCSGIGSTLTDGVVGRPFGSKPVGVDEVIGHRWVQLSGAEAQLTFVSERTSLTVDKQEIRCPLLLCSPDPASYAYNKIWLSYPERITYGFRIYGDRKPVVPEDVTSTRLTCQAVYDRKARRHRPATGRGFTVDSESAMVAAVRPKDEDVEVLVYEMQGKDTRVQIEGEGLSTSVASPDGLEPVATHATLAAGDVGVIVLSKEKENGGSDG